MTCPHAGQCPLFPLLKASLRSWREYYCDTGDGWRDCARYRLSLTGAVVPIVLLPNGANAQHLRAAAARVDPAAPARPTPPGGPGRGLRQPSDPPPAAFFEQASAPAGPPAHPLFPPAEQTPASTPAESPQRRRRWWTRLTDWISGPA
ncbi:hypothetical protein [Plantactinospora endophytica]|uniref:Uncharacterized protein n=1 Tax=Plantactinospora endophytica TaxID=673535 RepID=A0ABQ4E040_9ACTN|nr:hypothetical protein [Plantactinospora endophytica]GIG88094.1 hypothetical protein Pen02_30300 [Plantactinospora endophytica]